MSPYDPFSYGQVPVGKKQAGQPASPDDMLFADGGPARRDEPQADSSWALLAENVDNLLPGGGGGGPSVTEFGRDILGEAGASKPAARIRAAAGSAKPVAAGKPKAPVPPVKAAARSRTARPESLAAMKETVAPAPVAKTVTRSPLPMPRRRGISPTSVVGALAVLGGGGAGTWWFHAMQHNTVMAAIAGVTTAVGAALAWVMLRR